MQVLQVKSMICLRSQRMQMMKDGLIFKEKIIIMLEEHSIRMDLMVSEQMRMF